MSAKIYEKECIVERYVIGKGTKDMSAIWGAINLKGDSIGKETQNMLRMAFDKCVIDRYEESSNGNVYMGCGIQYFVPAAEKEKLPLVEENIYFTADVVLDNREELLKKLEITEKHADNMADGEILYAMYKRYGKSCLNDILGAYTFVWYDKSTNKIEMVLDAVGNRCVYYRIIGDIFYFSSLIEPLAELSKNTRLNDRWLTDFLAMDYLFMINETEETPLEGIYRIAPAQYISYQNGSLEKEIYWKPFDKFKEYRWSTDEEYKQKFRNLWNEAVTCNIRDKNNTSILLSGGLDSTAVAAVAAPYIKESGEYLHSYTSVPMEGFKADNSGYDVENEKEDVEKTAAFYGNIKPHYVDLNGKNPWELSKKAFRSMETPVKSIQNFLWIEEALQKAYDNKSRIMLTGSYGNIAISFTDLNTYMNTLYKKKRIWKLRKELAAFSANMGFSSKYAWKQIIKTKRVGFEPSKYPYGLSYVNRDMAEKMNTAERLEKIERNAFETGADFESYRHIMVQWLAMRQIGEAFTKHSLSTGVLLRDPTIDKRIITFCIHLPLEKFCREGLDRRLIKDYLKDIMPPHVMQFQKRGKQSADQQYRFSLKWDSIRKEWIQEYEKHQGSRYVDTLYAKRQLLEQKEIEYYSGFSLTRHMYTLLVLQYEAYFKQKYDVTYEENEKHNIKSEKPLISVMIPVYNAREYLKECLESVRNQTYRNLEIIVVDDGSTDGSGDLCDEIAKEDERIQVIHKENAGVSAARNDAMACAHGELFAFVDSDDKVEPDMYERMLEVMQEQSADYICCGVKYISDDGVTDGTDGKIKVFYNAEMLDTYESAYQRCSLTYGIWNGLYKRSLFEGLHFPNVMKYEDGLLKARVMARVKKGVFMNQPFYHYLLRGDKSSLSHMKMNLEDIEVYIRESEKNQELEKQLISRDGRNRMYFNYYCNLLTMYFAVDDKKRKRLLVQGMRRVRKQAREAFWDSATCS